MADTIHSVAQLGALLRRIRQQQDLTQAEVAEAAGVERQWLNRLEAGRSPGASISNVMHVLNTLQLDLAVQPAAPDVDSVFEGLV